MIYTLSMPANFLTKCFLVEVLGYGNEGREAGEGYTRSGSRIEDETGEYRP